MMGTQAAPERLFYDFCLEDHVPDDHLLRRTARALSSSNAIWSIKILRARRKCFGHLAIGTAVISRMTGSNRLRANGTARAFLLIFNDPKLHSFLVEANGLLRCTSAEGASV